MYSDEDIQVRLKRIARFIKIGSSCFARERFIVGNYKNIQAGGKFVDSLETFTVNLRRVNRIDVHLECCPIQYPPRGTSFYKSSVTIAASSSRPFRKLLNYFGADKRLNVTRRAGCLATRQRLPGDNR